MTDYLTQEQIDTFRARAAAAETRRELIVEVLHAIQDNHGWIPDAGVELAAQVLAVDVVEVEELATFYDKLYRQPVGKKVIHICDSICCWSRGAREIFTAVQDHLGIKVGETTADGVFTLLPTCCLGRCGEAPAMMVGLRIHGELTPASVGTILDQERAEALA
jgi:NADH-quinone oxidoreductase subunit E